MEKFHLEGSPKTPTVTFDADNGVLELRGRSIPENSVEFYGPLNDWLEKYESSPSPKTTLDMKLEYFNTSSSKCILDLFKRLEKMNGHDTNVHVNWYFETEDEDMAEAGEDYEAIVELPFSIIEVEEI
ncbi:MAG: DUF1987 domain-containing protein [Crocinitomicaceae bacterium]|nr:DUF1987 domain-containing protein [Crocinitomicaceae bacterium]